MVICGVRIGRTCRLEPKSGYLYWAAHWVASAATYGVHVVSAFRYGVQIVNGMVPGFLTA